MARALIVGCGCRGRELGAALRVAGWQVRGTSRGPAGADAIESAGLEAAVADPDRLITLLDRLEDVALVFWLLGSARDGQEAASALHGPRLERFLEVIVETPVRGFVYEAAGAAGVGVLARGAAIVRDAGERWRIPVEIVTADPSEHDSWRARMIAAAERLTGPDPG